ncbi:unnamed protein product [Effrenium voratum]|uniref:4Fe-4S ferredoxin-type domain-containing protein n=1 Tax=Effrenium voratum TaxID=2562239 RepID=A0AA36MZK5_9DINO|nr:unnamed protein product [Effrenium voratum]CAJ1385471.1 unnamed protein product [Effrenium voratum]
MSAPGIRPAKRAEPCGTLICAKRRRQRQLPASVQESYEEAEEAEYEDSFLSAPDGLDLVQAPMTPPDEGRCTVAAAFWQDSVEAEEDEAFGTSSTEVPPQDMEEADFEQVAVEDGDEGRALEEEELEAAEAEAEDPEEEGEEADLDPEAADPIPQPCTPQEPVPGDVWQPLHRTLPAARSNLRREKRPVASVSFAQVEVEDSYLLDDVTGLKAVIHVESYRDEDLWYSNPGAAVRCGWCERICPQSLGKLHGEEGRSQFAQPDFVCNSCLEAAQDAYEAWLAQKEAEPDPPQNESLGESGPWDNPASGWSEWAGE